MFADVICDDKEHNRT